MLVGVLVAVKVKVGELVFTGEMVEELVGVPV